MLAMLRGPPPEEAAATTSPPLFWDPLHRDKKEYTPGNGVTVTFPTGGMNA